MNYVDRLINRITMYRLLLYYLGGLLLVAMMFGAFGIIAYPPQMIFFSACITIVTCYVVNHVFARIYNAPSNTESSLITGLILALIITPMASIKDIPFLLAASGLAIASKYILAVGNKHIFNPAAVAVVLTAFGPGESASWWVGSAALLPCVLVGGVLIIRKIRRTVTLLIYVLAATCSVIFFATIAGHSIATSLQTMLLHSSLFFLGFVMLTEPWTSPSVKLHRYIYAGIIGLLFSPLIQIAGIYSTPELSLIIGNLYAFLVTPIAKTRVYITRRRMFGNTTEDIELTPEHQFIYKPGQYVEMTLPHKGGDARGFRRYFTLASSPTEATLRLGVRYYENGSTFKDALHDSDENTAMSVGQVGGDFTLPRDRDQKLAFIAGGIGITPFRSMVKYLVDTDDERSIVLLYGERAAKDIAYGDVFQEAQHTINMKVRYVLGESSSASADTLVGVIDRGVIEREIPDYSSRVFYVSGPQPMVVAVTRELRALGVSRRNIKVDYFFGYA